MSSDLKRKKATEAVDWAWQEMKAHPSPEAEAAYDHAYTKWKELGIERGVGRPPNSETSALTSSERAQAARLCQQQSAARWEKVAPLIQNIRKSMQMGDRTGALQIVNSLIEETAMTLTNLKVVHAQPNSDHVVLQGWHERQMVLAFIPTMHLEDHFRRDRLTGKQANLLVDRNLEALARIISAKYERGEQKPYSRFGSTYPRIDITLQDIENSGESLTDSVLDMSAGWMSPDGRWSPA